MEQNNIGSDVAELDRFIQDLESSLQRVNAPDCVFDPCVQECMNLPHEDFLSLSPQEAQANAYKLNQYSLFLYKEIDSNSAKVSWCEEIINTSIAKKYKEFPDYMKYEVRRQAVIHGDDFLYKVDAIRLKVNALLSSLKNRIKPVETMISIFQRKAYDNR